MSLDRTRCRPLLQSFDFRTLFVEELGWDKHKVSLDIPLEAGEVHLESIAHKRGFVAWHCPEPASGFPDAAARRKIEREVAKAAHEHLIVFTDAAKTRQIWQWVRRDPGQPLRVRDTAWTKGQAGEIVLQQLAPLFVSLDEEETLTLVDVTTRARANVSERITKRFYDEFRKQHGAFLKFIKGIPNQGDHEWYASVMLNRLMFVYFVQKKGFLDGDTNYLRNRLTTLQAQNKGDKFYSFYRAFLLRLFHEGLGAKKRKSDLEKLIGRVPYLNGGIFDVHQLERDYGAEIQIPDKAFEQVFDYFDRYHWHLDERPLRADNEINPDVLGYIFEKYINQKQMGAYYTKEDITEYIGKSCIIPFLLDATRAKCKVAFENPDGPTVWNLLKEDPDRYIYPAVRHGCQRPLPKEIAAGIDTKKPNLIERRKAWNKPAPEEFALPTEIWRETVARRQRYEEIHRKLGAGEVCEVNDLVTLNLDIRQFAQDVIRNCEGPDLLMAIWRALSPMSILDPTGGSGAFLFAALGILEPLYEGCLDRMQGFLDEWGKDGRKTHRNYHKEFSQILEQVAAHPNRRYFVLKSIILNNLYAVDIMEEAVEICKLRLFLKLAAQIDPDPNQENFGIEPLPDIDFNIRCGNTLVGYATADEVRRCMTEFGGGQMKLLDESELNSFARFNNDCADVEQTFAKFRQIQTEGDGTVPPEHKKELQMRLQALDDQLNQHLAGEYGVKAGDKKAYEAWLKSHQPFHWFIQFYGILNGGGFDVIVGNPPYVGAAKVRKTYTVQNFATADCSDIYAWVLERAESLLRSGGRTGMIVPLSLGFSGDFDSCRRLLLGAYGANWFSSFGRIPAALFAADVRVRNTIHIGHKTNRAGKSYTTRLHRWFEAARPSLVPSLEYVAFEPALWKNRIPKINTPALVQAFETALRTRKRTIDFVISQRATKHVLHFKKTAYNWLNFCRKMPPCYEGSRLVSHTQFDSVSFTDSEIRDIAFLLLNGKLLMIFWFAVGDDFHVAKWNFSEFPSDFSEISKSQRVKLLEISATLEKEMNAAVQFKLNAGRRVGNYNLAKCRDATNQSDFILAEALGFADAWEDIELYYTQTIKTEFSGDEKKI